MIDPEAPRIERRRDRRFRQETLPQLNCKTAAREELRMLLAQCRTVGGVPQQGVLSRAFLQDKKNNKQGCAGRRVVQAMSVPLEGLGSLHALLSR